MIEIKDTFLELTKRRYPKGTEDVAMEIVKSILPDVEFKKDEFDNYYVYIPRKDGSDSDTMFTSHLDTIDSGPINRTWNATLKRYETPSGAVDDKAVNHVFDDDFVKTDGTSNLGADDKAGTTIMMNMISEKVPGLYYFFMGEESGCVGSSNLSRVFNTKEFPKMNKCISFDRRGYDSIITHQSGRCASDVFAKELASRLNEYMFWFEPDPTGVYTDSAEFTDIIPECTNISVGYFSEHTKTEKQDLEFLFYLAKVCTAIDWETLPIERDKDKVYTGKKSKHNYRGNYYDEDYYGYGYGTGGYNGRNSGTSGTRGTSVTRKPNISTHTSTNNTEDIHSKVFTDDGNGTITEVNDFEFDQWYNEQKKKEVINT